MKLITLNIWGGYLHDDLLLFMAEYHDIDIFCFQEVYHDADEKISTCDMPLSLRLFNDIAACLPHHAAYFCPVVASYGLAIFVKKSIQVVDSGEHMIHSNDAYIGKGPTHQRKLQWLICEDQGKQHTICNVHGLWNGQGKGDSPERLKQSEKIHQFATSLSMPTIVCGDFNLKPDTESLSIIKQCFVDLIQKFQVTSTRTSYYKKTEKHADYVFTSPNIVVHDFKVLQDEVSDHAPLYLSYSV